MKWEDRTMCSCPGFNERKTEVTESKKMMREISEIILHDGIYLRSSGKSLSPNCLMRV